MAPSDNLNHNRHEFKKWKNSPNLSQQSIVSAPEKIPRSNSPSSKNSKDDNLPMRAFSNLYIKNNQLNDKMAQSKIIKSNSLRKSNVQEDGGPLLNFSTNEQLQIKYYNMTCKKKAMACLANQETVPKTAASNTGSDKTKERRDKSRRCPPKTNNSIDEYYNPNAQVPIHNPQTNHYYNANYDNGLELQPKCDQYYPLSSHRGQDNQAGRWYGSQLAFPSTYYNNSSEYMQKWYSTRDSTQQFPGNSNNSDAPTLVEMIDPLKQRAKEKYFSMDMGSQYPQSSHEGGVYCDNYFRDSPHHDPSFYNLDLDMPYYQNSEMYPSHNGYRPVIINRLRYKEKIPPVKKNHVEAPNNAEPEKLIRIDPPKKSSNFKVFQKREGRKKPEYDRSKPIIESINGQPIPVKLK